MKTILREEVISGALRRIKAVADKGYFDGKHPDDYFISCHWLIMKYECSLIFTRDVGAHSCGWKKNPDYERCYHLSVSFKSGKNKNALEKILTGLFGEHKRKLWIEPPHSVAGKRNDVWHYRLFCDQFWQPIIPRGEPYSTEFTELGWKSYSEVQSNKIKFL